MKRVGMQASEGLELTGMGGLVLVGAVLKRFTAFQAVFNGTFSKGPGGIPFRDVLVPGLAMLCTGKSDFEAVSQLRGSAWAARALQVGHIASPETLRQNLDLLGEKAFPSSLAIIETAILDVLRNTNMRPSHLWTGHVALDIDTTPQDNSKTQKEKVGRTYKGCDGFCPILAYAGVEGFLIGGEFREGTQHSQKGAPAFIANQIQRLRSLGVDRVLVRLDSGFDAGETMLRIRGEGADFIISVNPRGEDKNIWLDPARALPRSAWIRLKGVRNLRIAYLERMETRRDQDGNEIQVRRIVRVKKFLCVAAPPKPKRKRKGKPRKEPAGTQPALVKPWRNFEMGSSWSTQLDLPAPEIARLYEDHGTSEQFHSEMKSELDLERLPSGKFKTNTLVFQMGYLAYNVLRVLGIGGKAVFRYRQGAVPAPYTVISAGEVAVGAWRPSPRLSREDQVWCLGYVERLAEGRRHPLVVWPPYCLIGSEGHAVEAGLHRSLCAWATRAFARVEYHAKGSNHRTEHYSALAAEVPDPADPATAPNRVCSNCRRPMCSWWPARPVPIACPIGCATWPPPSIRATSASYTCWSIAPAMSKASSSWAGTSWRSWRGRACAWWTAPNSSG